MAKAQIVLGDFRDTNLTGADLHSAEPGAGVAAAQRVFGEVGAPAPVG